VISIARRFAGDEAKNTCVMFGEREGYNVLVSFALKSVSLGSSKEPLVSEEDLS